MSGMLHFLGLLPRRNQNILPHFIRQYQSIREHFWKPQSRIEKNWNRCDNFRLTFARDAGEPNNRFPVHFLGLWDTVSSVGFWNPIAFPFSARNPSNRIVRHAVSIDERRAFFRQNLVWQLPGSDIEQIWFPGVHADVGGGYNDGKLWKLPFLWIVTEAQRAGLLVDQHRMHFEVGGPPFSEDSWTWPLHESLDWRWWLAEFLPRRQWNAGTGRIRFGLFGRRYIPEAFSDPQFCNSSLAKHRLSARMLFA